MDKLPQINREQFRWDCKLGKFLADSSCLGFGPDYWPLFFEVETKIGRVIFGRRDAKYKVENLVMTSDTRHRGELISYDYFTEKGNHQMTVFND